ncbi:MAG: segregation/condensation protein A [Anaerolineales bacterium]|nr:segregation/condensation protein A [Anaerolineales bacterium]
MLSPPIYTIQLPVYEGPLDLLLNLIEHAELDITKVSLAEVTDQYLVYIRQIQDRQLEDLASFLVMAARLIQIKSEVLLPRPPLREPGEEDPGDALARQLVAYKKYKQVAILLSEREESGLRSYIRLAPPPVIDPKIDMQEFQLDDLYQAMLEVLKNVHKIPTLEENISTLRVSVRDKILNIIHSLKDVSQLSFRKLIKTARSRLEIVVSLLAILELIKQDQVEVRQEEMFGDIELVRGSGWQVDQIEELEFEFDE